MRQWLSICKAAYRKLRRRYCSVMMYVAALFAHVFVSKRSKIVEVHEGDRSLKGAAKVAVFLHYDRHGHLADFVLFYLEALYRAGFEIVFVSNSPELPSATWAQLKPLCALMVRRRNLGHDFGGYKDGLALIDDLESREAVIVANDSVYGPLSDLAPILRGCDDGAAVWGMTDNWERRYHLQSYFLLFRKTALSHPAFRAFWDKVHYVPSRLWIIKKYEIGLSQEMIKNGLRCSALFPYRRVTGALTEAVLHRGLLRQELLPDHHRQYLEGLFEAVESGVPLNPTHFLWDYLIADMGCPFIKRDLLMHNRFSIPYVSQWERLIRESTSYNPDLILRHLEIAAKNRAV
jgi:lipopolysaccharide biosynthesis protein